MNIYNLKPIPKYIVNLIRKKDKITYKTPSGQVRFYSYLTKVDKELIQVTVAVKNKYKNWHIKQVAVHSVDSKICYAKDINYFFLGGYVVGWFEEGLTKYPKWWESSKWELYDDKYFHMQAPVINKEFALKFKEYKYSAIELYSGSDITTYLTNYLKHPIVEYLMKIGLYRYIYSSQIVTLLEKDKKFRKWLIKNAPDIKNKFYYVASVIKAYRKNVSVETVQRLAEFRQDIKGESFKTLKETFKKDFEKFATYIAEQKTQAVIYNDYLKACLFLGLDMENEKNRYPRDFKRWHDIRIDEYHTAKAEKDEQERKEFYAKFLGVATKYLPLESNKKYGYIAIIAKKPSELVNEGNVLQHCVGRMNYDQKMLREESLIFFIRSIDSPETPLVTVEYSIASKKILQCYAMNNKRPSEDILEFINKKWLPHTKRQLKKIA